MAIITTTAPPPPSTSPSTTSPTTPTTITTDYLIIGAGPAGASLACFLARSSLTGILLSSSPGPARTPRAHLVNASALECLRDLDTSLYAECLALGTRGAPIAHYRWCETMAGTEYARVRAWGAERPTEYERVSPCGGIMDLPQSLMEPVLLKYASGRGWSVRFDTRLSGFGVEEGGGVLASVVDEVNGVEYRIQAKYLFGADGGRSFVARELGLPFSKSPFSFSFEARI